MKSNGLSDFGYAPDRLTHYIGNYVSAWLTKLKVRCERGTEVREAMLVRVRGLHETPYMVIISVSIIIGLPRFRSL